MAKDPAFLFYPADASEDTQFLNRLERGCYFDILKAQKKFKRFPIDTIKKVLGRDFEACWGSLEPVLKHDSEGYFIEWADDAIEKRKIFTESRRKNRSKANNDALFIYLMVDESTGHYKIGSSVNPIRRHVELQSRFPNIKLLYSFGETNQKSESDLHEMFKNKQIVNEFFDLDKDDIIHMIEHMCVHMKLHMTKHMLSHMSPHIDDMLSHMSLHIDSHMVEHMVNENGIVFKNKGKEGVSNNMLGGVGEENYGEGKGKEFSNSKKTIPPIVLSGTGAAIQFVSDEFVELWKKWRIYRFEQHEFIYKAMDSEQAAFAELAIASGFKEDIAIKIIMSAMASGWKRFYALDDKKMPKGSILPSTKDFEELKKEYEYTRNK